MRVGVEDVVCFQTLLKLPALWFNPHQTCRCFFFCLFCFLRVFVLLIVKSLLWGVWTGHWKVSRKQIVKNFWLALLIKWIFKTIIVHWWNNAVNQPLSFFLALSINVYWICSIVLLLLQRFNPFYQICINVFDIFILGTLECIWGKKLGLARAQYNGRIAKKVA